MAAAKSTPKTTKSSDLLLYRLEQVEAKVDSIGTKLDSREHISRADLIEFKDTILERFNEKNAQLQADIDAKADLKDVQDLKGLVKAFGLAILTVAAGVLTFYLTQGKT